jgi:hypothetical protein
MFRIFICLSLIEYSDSNSAVYGVRMRDILWTFQDRGGEKGPHLSTEPTTGDSQ